MPSMKERFDEFAEKGKQMKDKAFHQIGMGTERALGQMNIKKEDLSKLDGIRAIVGFMGLVINLVLFSTQWFTGWFTGTAMYDGHPYAAFASLGAVQFGLNGADTHIFATSDGPCEGASGDTCDLSALCNWSPPITKFAAGKYQDYTPQSTWCDLSQAGTWATSFLMLGLVPGLAATGFTLIYAAQGVDKASKIFECVQKAGFTEAVQKKIISACWGVFWLFLFVAMGMFSAKLPKTLGSPGSPVGTEASFGLLRLCFLLVTLCGSALVVSLFKLWNAENVAEAWREFTETKFASAKKALYLLLMLQMALYILLTIQDFQWELMLVGICGYYLDAKKRNFLLVYLVLVAMSLLFNFVELVALPGFDTMTSGDSFGTLLKWIIFLSKFAVLGAIYMYEKEKQPSESDHHAYMPQHDNDEEIAE
jgi:hypothetical protein